MAISMAMKFFSVKINIACSPEEIWTVLMDTSSYPEWATGTHRLEGQIAPGETLELFTASKPDKSMTLKVSHLEPQRTFTLSGGLPFNSFKGDRTFTLIPQADGTTDFSMREVFSGWLSPLLGRLIPDLTKSFETYAAGLKKQCEGKRS